MSDARAAERAAAESELNSTRVQAQHEVAERDREMGVLKREIESVRMENARLAAAVDEHTTALAAARAEAQAQIAAANAQISEVSVAKDGELERSLQAVREMQSKARQQELAAEQAAEDHAAEVAR